MTTVVTGQQGKDGAPLILDLATKDRSHRTLTVEIDHQYPVPIKRGRHGQMRRGRGLAHTTFEIRDGDNLGGQPLGAPGFVFLGLRSFCCEMGAKPQYLIQGEPFGAAIGF